MSDPLVPPAPSPAPASTRRGRPSADAKSTDVQVSAMVPADLKAQIKARADEEERAESTVIRRAIKAYMSDWTPGANED